MTDTAQTDVTTLDNDYNEMMAWFQPEHAQKLDKVFKPIYARLQLLETGKTVEDNTRVTDLQSTVSSLQQQITQLQTQVTTLLASVQNATIITPPSAATASTTTPAS